MGDNRSRVRSLAVSKTDRPIDLSADNERWDGIAQSCDALLEALNRHHACGAGELNVPRDALAPRRYTSNVTHQSLIGSSASLCSEV